MEANDCARTTTYTWVVAQVKPGLAVVVLPVSMVNNALIMGSFGNLSTWNTCMLLMGSSSPGLDVAGAIG